MLHSLGDVPSRWLLSITPLLVGGFVAASLYSTRQTRVIENDAVNVVSNAAPSIQHLSAARSIMSHLETSTGMAFADVAEGRPVDRTFVAEDERQLREQLGAYLVLPFDPGERPLYEQVIDHLRRFQTADHHVLDLLGEGRRATARQAMRSEMRPQADATAQAIKALIDFNAAQIFSSAERVLQLRPRVEAISYLLHALAVVLALLLLWLAWRAIRGAERDSDTRRFRAEERAEELELFAGRVAHDLKNPLAAIAMRVQLAQQHGDESYARLDRQVRSMSTLIEGLLDFAVAGARPAPGARTQLELVASDLLITLREEASHADATLAIEPLPSVTLACAPGAFTSIVSNLVRNAIKFVAGRPVRGVVLRASRYEHTVRIEVEDTGPGIPPGQEQRLFKPFVRLPGEAQVPGLGLGLATVRRLAEGYGGKVGVRSVLGAGATFWVELPLASPALPS